MPFETPDLFGDRQLFLHYSIHARYRYNYNLQTVIVRSFPGIHRKSRTTGGTRRTRHCHTSCEFMFACQNCSRLAHACVHDHRTRLASQGTQGHRPSHRKTLELPGLLDWNGMHNGIRIPSFTYVVLSAE